MTSASIGNGRAMKEVVVSDDEVVMVALVVVHSNIYLVFLKPG